MDIGVRPFGNMGTGRSNTILSTSNRTGSNVSTSMLSHSSRNTAWSNKSNSSGANATDTLEQATAMKNKHTLLIFIVYSKDGKHRWLYVKPERHSVRGLKALVGHGTSYLQKRLSGQLKQASGQARRETGKYNNTMRLIHAIYTDLGNNTLAQVMYGLNESDPTRILYGGNKVRTNNFKGSEVVVKANNAKEVKSVQNLTKFLNKLMSTSNISSGAFLFPVKNQSRNGLSTEFLNSMIRNSYRRPSSHAKSFMHTNGSRGLNIKMNEGVTSENSNHELRV